MRQTELSPTVGGARRALRDVLRDIVGSGPVFVSFSGGRDSSAILAVATSVARELGSDLPVPVTYRYPGDPNADEDEWQDLVLRHLGVTEPLVLDITEQHRLLGEPAQASMARRGLVWPVPANLQHEMYSQVGGATLLTGEGGDELLSGLRVAPVARVLRTFRRRRRPGRRQLWQAGRALLPQRVTTPGAAASLQQELVPWLRGTARDQFAAEIRRDLTEPVRWDEAIRKAAQRPLGRAVYHNLDVVAREYDVRLVHPLLAPEFVSAWMVDGGRWGFTGRTTAMRYLFDDVLPERILGRSSKAFFNTSRFGDAERAFARQWDGRGLDRDHVDPEVLRQVWLRDDVGGPCDTALMAAWMASEGLPLEGPPR